ncbi:putative Cell division control protein 2-like protein A [Hypsibius exemplaris]|uniref:Cell division control protein 2-like protein A n=1 Tax=Hypsibius exemplaris TaxID=2072580 RepID=A0A9X6NGK8_HYPEX|nr:putative Cell division control protein 2-like protein A [Hypsibius exemplaris]
MCWSPETSAKTFFMDDFDYDEAERRIRLHRSAGHDRAVHLERGKGVATEVEQAPLRRPGLHLLQTFNGLRVLQRPGEVDDQLYGNLRDMNDAIERKYQMDEPSLEDATNFDRWTSLVPTEVSAITEFPKQFFKARSAFRFRKHYWGVQNYPLAEPPTQAELAGLDAPSPRKRPDGGPGFFPALTKEISSLRQVGPHCNLVTLLDVFCLGSTIDDLAVVLVFPDWGYTLHDILSFPDAKARMDDSPVMRRRMFQQVLRGLAHIHSKKIIHRNITSSSVKVDEKGCVRIGSFNYAIVSDVTVRAAPFPEEDFPKALQDTYDHLAPEILLGSKSYRRSSDIWSVGMLLAELYLHRTLYTPLSSHPIPGTDHFIPLERSRHTSLPVILNMYRLFGTPTDETFPDWWTFPYSHRSFPDWPAGKLAPLLRDLPSDARTLVTAILRYDESKRPTAVDLLQSVGVDT